jgi:exodeoxyribonuclease VII large subunit
MAEPDENPPTLASLILGPAKRRPAARPEAFPRPGGQLGLVFSTPTETVLPQVPIAPAPIAMVHVPIAATPRADPAPTLPGSAHKPWSVRALVAGIRQQVELSYADLWVEGEISNCRPAPSGHIYFTLRDGEAQLPVVLFRRQAQLLRFRPQDGMAVLARGKVSIYESRGQLQLIADTLEPRGAGALQLAFEQLKTRLLAEGLFDAARKRALPPYPRCIGVITSTGGAVLHDIVKVVRRRHARLHVLIYPATMQGSGCAASVTAGIRWFNRNPDRVQLIVMARGGGSLEDLAGFNDEGLARAIAASALPTVSAIGHETDFTIADFVADLRAPTPSSAAEMITAAQHRVEERVAALEGRMQRAIRYQMMLARQRYTRLSAAQVLDRVRDLAARRQQRLDELHRRMESAVLRHLRVPAARLAGIAARLERQNLAVRLAAARLRLDRAQVSVARLASTTIVLRSTRLAHASARLEAMSPLAVLNRGYAIVYAADGTLLRDAAEAAPGETIRARLARGSVLATIDDIAT